MNTHLHLLPHRLLLPRVRVLEGALQISDQSLPSLTGRVNQHLMSRYQRFNSEKNLLSKDSRTFHIKSSFYTKRASFVLIVYIGNPLFLGIITPRATGQPTVSQVIFSVWHESLYLLDSVSEFFFFDILVRIIYWLVSVVSGNHPSELILIQHSHLIPYQNA